MTPGPWKEFTGWGASQRNPVVVDCTPDVDGKFIGNCICYIATSNDQYRENTRAIVATPVLLAACKQAVNDITKEQGIDAVYERFMYLLNAIAEAEGGFNG